MERTLVIIKPDAVQRGLVGEIISRFERRGLRIAAMKLMHITPKLAHRLYAIHEGKAFFEGLIEFITSNPVVLMVLEGNNAIEVVRRTMGATNPAEASPGTIRADLGLEVGRNLVHGSDSPETAAYEIPIFFREEEILSYSRDVDRWVFE
ncbi:MAG: nucleoside-diphosphate kinase [Chloroflexota bacterium]|nr:nucleoside-diphosphate kinase [Chloroflexota bacterium]